MAKAKDKGVVLFAFGNRHYYGAAFNLAYSIKNYNPSIEISLFVDSVSAFKEECNKDLENVFSSINDIEAPLLYTDGKLDPGKLKVNLYGLLPYKYNLYLDVDAVCLKDIEPLFNEFIESGKPYISHTVGYHTDFTKRDFPQMQWAWMDDVSNHFGLKDGDVLPAINSSLQFIVKSKEAESIYKTAKDFYENNPLPTEKLRLKWGGGQPDELYMNVSLALNKVNPAHGETGSDGKTEYGFIHFASVRGLSLTQVVDRYYFQSYYGGKGFTPAFYTEWLDRMLNTMMVEHGLNHEHRIEHIIRHKYANKR